LSKILAKVNGVLIYKSFLDRLLDEYIAKNNKLNEFDINQLKIEILENLIDRALLVSYARNNDIILSPIELNNIYIDDEELGSVPLSEKFDLNDSESCEDATNEIIKLKMINQLLIENDKFEYEESVIKEFYKENKNLFQTTDEVVKVRHILISTDYALSKEDKIKAKQQIQEAYELLKKGADFEDVARKYSNCPSKDFGGDLGYITKGTLSESFEKIAFTIDINKISDIFETEYGFHILQVTDRKNNFIQPYEKVKNRLKEHIKKERFTYMLDNLLNELRDDAEIEIFSI